MCLPPRVSAAPSRPETGCPAAPANALYPTRAADRRELVAQLQPPPTHTHTAQTAPQARGAAHNASAQWHHLLLLFSDRFPKRCGEAARVRAAPRRSHKRVGACAAGRAMRARRTLALLRLLAAVAAALCAAANAPLAVAGAGDSGECAAVPSAGEAGVLPLAAAFGAATLLDVTVPLGVLTTPLWDDENSVRWVW